ncbi:tyrosine-type recombinase/integrase [Polaribacter sp. IC073]|uniref:tyrosine-type recombinase/integrase n=1 Tax=Polaribacter sp. IC073 TaxID=2508540 RepID=UPI00167AC7EF|nr:site-specific integrase [Polaribacter sp. IC073]
MRYSKPKIFIPKSKNKKGDLKPTTAVGKYWYVKYSYRNPKTGVMEVFRVKEGINRVQTIKERTRAIKCLRIAVQQFLEMGYSPFEYIPENVIEKKTWTTKEALELALEEKQKVWSVSTIKINHFPVNVFIRYLETSNLYHKDIKDITKRHIIIFLNNLGKDKNKPVNPTTRNTYRKIISSLFNQLVADDIISKNFVESIPKLAAKPKKNIPFRKKEMETIKEHLLEHDPYLYLFIKFVMYGFFRPVEVCRIKIKDINIDRNTISVKSKTEDATANTVFLTKQLKETIAEMDIHKFDSDFYLFTSKLEPSNWLVDDTIKRTYFGRRFAKVKKELKFDENYGIYSFRHTAAIDIFTTYKEQGLTDLEAKHKMLPITRHKSIDSLNKYLRDIGASLPKDYSDDYSLDF